MSVLETIRARVALPCTIRPSGAEHLLVKAQTEELTRDSVTVLVRSRATLAWLAPSADVIIAIELPFHGHFTPRVLECGASLTRILTGKERFEVHARVDRMHIAERKNELSKEPAIDLTTPGKDACRDRAIAKQLTIPSNSQGDKTMSFLKNFIREEEGQGMVEYGLILGLVVFAAVAAWQGFSTALNNGIGTQKTNLTTDMGS